MLYKINATIVLNSEQDYNSLWITLKNFLNKDTIISLNKGKINEEKTRISRHECLHEENQPCINPETIEK